MGVSDVIFPFKFKIKCLNKDTYSRIKSVLHNPSNEEIIVLLSFEMFSEFHLRSFLRARIHKISQGLIYSFSMRSKLERPLKFVQILVSDHPFFLRYFVLLVNFNL